MNSIPSQGNDEAQEILEALRKIQENDELRAEAVKNPDAVAARLGLSGIARHAVAFGIAGLLVAPAITRPTGWWSS
jgi:hypothetical protein